MLELLKFPYGGSAPSPYWGPQTSAFLRRSILTTIHGRDNTTDHVEDYVITRYIAEFINTITSLAYIIYGLLGIFRHQRQHNSVFSTDTISYYGLIGIGVFSGLYHTTMKYHTQMADEMSMHLAMGCVLIRLFTFQQPSSVQQRNTAIIVVGLTSFVIYHCLMDEFILHVILFFTLSVTVGWKSYDLIQSGTRPEAQKKILSSLVTFATCNALLAYGIWNIDVNFCSLLTKWKHNVGLPWGIVLELHGWWHVMTAVSCYTFMALIEFLTTPRVGKDPAPGFVWPVKNVLQQLAPSTKAA